MPRVLLKGAKGDLVVMTIAAIVMTVSALAFMPLLLGTLLLGFGQLAPEQGVSPPINLPLIILWWIPATCLSVRNVAYSLTTLNLPSWTRALNLLGTSAMALVMFHFAWPALE